MNTHIDDLAICTSKFMSADMELLSSRSLQRRLDQKYIMGIDQLHNLLENLCEHYTILPTSNQNVSLYQTKYFDTQEFTFFKNHLRGKRPRYKVRLRRYPDRQLCMLECKEKNAADITIKHRIEVPYSTNSLVNHHEFIGHVPCCPSTLVSSLSNTFHRITLLHKTLQERLTIDFNIEFYTETAQFSLDRCIIVERKRLPAAKRSTVPSLLRRFRAYPLSISKYCIGGYHLLNTNKNTLYRTKSRILRSVIYDRTI